MTLKLILCHKTTNFFLISHLTCHCVHYLFHVGRISQNISTTHGVGDGQPQILNQRRGRGGLNAFGFNAG